MPTINLREPRHTRTTLTANDIKMMCKVARRVKITSATRVYVQVPNVGHVEITGTTQVIVSSKAYDQPK